MHEKPSLEACRRPVTDPQFPTNASHDAASPNGFERALFFLFLAFLLIAALMLAPLQDVSAVKWFVVRVFAPMLLAAWIARRAFRGYVGWPWGPLGVLGLSFLATHAVSGFQAVNPGYTLTKVSELVGLLATFFLVVHLVRDTLDRDRTVWMLVLIGAFTAIYGIAQHHGYDFFPWEEHREVPTDRGSSFFGHATFTGSVLAQLIPLALGLAFTRRGWVGRVLALGIALLMLYHLSFSGARMATVSLMAALATGGAVWGLLWLRARPGTLRSLVTWPRVAAAILLLVMASVAAAWFVSRAWGVKGSDLFAIRQASLALRLYTWETSSRMLFDHPWTGIGAGNFEVVAPTYWNEVEQMWSARFGRWMHEVHNEYLETAVEQGVFGLAVLLGLFAYAVVMSLDLAAHGCDRRERVLGIAFFASVVAIALDANITFSLQAPGSALVLWTVLGLISWSHFRLRQRRQTAPQ